VTSNPQHQHQHHRANRRRWLSTITYGGKKHHLGSFGTKQEAALAYDKEVRQLGEEKKALNYDTIEEAEEKVEEAVTEAATQAEAAYALALLQTEMLGPAPPLDSSLGPPTFGMVSMVVASMYSVQCTDIAPPASCEMFTTLFTTPMVVAAASMYSSHFRG
jgi:hypothetical protein